MALNITTQLSTSIGIDASNAYGRIGVTDGPTGTAIVSSLSIYASEAAFTGSADPLPVFNPNTGRLLEQGITFSYDRATDGEDILGLAHTQWVNWLASQGITAQIAL